MPGALVDAVPLKKTTWFAAGDDGENEKFATSCDAVVETVTVLNVVADCPAALETVSETEYDPACENRCVVVRPVPPVPSPKFQVKVPLFGVDAEALKKTS